MTRPARTAMTAALSDLVANTGAIDVEVLHDDDLPGVAELMAAAYAGTTDDEGGSASDALVELRAAADGAHGEPLRAAWLGVRRDDRWVSAVVCTRRRSTPFVAFLFTDHAWTGAGLATGLLGAAARDLLAAEEHGLGLVVTDANPAARLYRRLGFVAVPPAADGGGVADG